MVVWTPSFAQLIDATLVQDPTLLSMARVDPLYSTPVLVKVPTDRDELLRTRPVLALDDRLFASWVLLPEWTATMDAVLAGPLGPAASLGALALATDALKALRGLSEDRDLDPLSARYPRLGALLAGREHLPALPAGVPVELMDE